MTRVPLGALTADDQRRISRLLDAFESGQLNESPSGQRRRVVYATPFISGKADSEISAGASGAINVWTSTGATGEQVEGFDWLGQGVAAGEKVHLHRNMADRDENLYIDIASTGGVGGSSDPFLYGVVASTSVEPNSTALITIWTTTGATTTMVGARNLTADRFPGSAIASLPETKVKLWRHDRSGELLFERVASMRRFFSDAGVASRPVNTGYVAIQETSTLLGVVTTGFSLSASTNSTAGWKDTLTIKDAGLYRIDWSANANPTITDQARVNVELGPVRDPVDATFGGFVNTHLITGTTASDSYTESYMSTAERIALSGFGFGVASTANTKIHIRANIFASGTTSTTPARISNLRVAVTGNVYKTQ